MSDQTERVPPTGEEVMSHLARTRNWGRWGDDDQKGAINLITPAKLLAALRLARTGRTVSLAREFPTQQGPHNWNPAEQWWRWAETPTGGGFAFDYVGLNSHGVTATHIDALCHTWDQDGMWNGRKAEDHLKTTGVTWGGLEHWREGIITRGVLLDVPGHRGVPYVTVDEPVHGWELEDILVKRGITLEPGDAVCIFSGREAWQADHPDKPYYRYRRADGLLEAPGLHASCLSFIRDHDVSTVVWDMVDASPLSTELNIPYSVHAATYAYGVALLDSALLEPLVAAVAEEQRDDFLFITVPPYMRGATGATVNPLAIF
jgi:kynurenine formamidase